jgi:hypothetical protein
MRQGRHPTGQEENHALAVGNPQVVPESLSGDSIVTSGIRLHEVKDFINAVPVPAPQIRWTAHLVFEVGF